jgi:hypothetical protein
MGILKEKKKGPLTFIVSGPFYKNFFGASPLLQSD